MPCRKVASGIAAAEMKGNCAICPNSLICLTDMTSTLIVKRCPRCNEIWGCMGGAEWPGKTGRWKTVYPPISVMEGILCLTFDVQTAFLECDKCIEE